VETLGKKPKSRLHNVSCTSLIPKDVFDAGVLKKWHPEEDEALGGPSAPKRRRRGKKAEEVARDVAKEVASTDEGTRRRKRKCGKCNKKGGKRTNRHTECVGGKNNVSVPELPDEIWIKILSLVLVGGQYPTMHR
jgi:hypothetical protein